MKRSYLSVVIAMMCLLVMGGTAGAQDSEGIVASVPFEFVVGATTMPAGSYKVMRISRVASSPLVIRGQENSTLVLPIVVDNVSAAQPAALDFERVGDKYILSKVETLDHVYTFRVPRPTTMLVQVKDHGEAVSVGTK